jgi:hypothetical protein
MLEKSRVPAFLILPHFRKRPQKDHKGNKKFKKGYTALKIILTIIREEIIWKKYYMHVAYCISRTSILS